MLLYQSDQNIDFIYVSKIKYIILYLKYSFPKLFFSNRYLIYKG